MAMQPGGGGTRQQRAAQLRAEEEARRAAQQGGLVDPNEGLDNEALGGTGPVGQGDYIVREGDCMSSIAKDSGHFWGTLWNAPENEELREVRKNPNTLLPGDKVFIPELRPKEEACETEARHRFIRRGEPAKLRLRLVRGPSQFLPDNDDGVPPGKLAQDQPWANVPYKLVVDGRTFEGTSDGDGWIEVNIPGNATKGKLLLHPGEPEEIEMPVELGQLAPISELKGVMQRLENLGLRSGNPGTYRMTPEVREAVRKFQQQHGLPATGELSDETRQKLVEVHGS